MATKKKRTAKETWEALERQAREDEIDRFLAKTPEEVDRDLREAGLDPEKIREEGAALGKRLLADRARLAWQKDAAAGQARDRARIDAIAGRYAKEGRTELLARLAAAKASPRLQGHVSFMFRNHTEEAATDDELRGMLEDLDALAERGE